MSRILQAIGMVAITAGVAWMSLPLGIVIGGIFLLVVGLSLAI